MKFSYPLFLIITLLVIMAIGIKTTNNNGKPQATQPVSDKREALRASVVKAINDASLEANTGIKAVELASLLVITSPPMKSKKDKANLAVIIAEIEGKWKSVSDSPIAVMDNTTGEYIYRSDK